MTKQYQLVSEMSDIAKTVLKKTGIGAVAGMIGGGIVDYIRNIKKRRQADEKKTEYLLKHANDYSDDEVKNWAISAIKRYEDRITEIRSVIDEIMRDKQISADRASRLEAAGKGSKYTGIGSRVGSDIQVTSLRKEIQIYQQLIFEIRQQLLNKDWKSIRSRMVSNDAENYKNKYYDRIKHKNSKWIGAAIGAGLGGAGGGFSALRRKK